MLIHIDTDFAGDIDDACALAMVLGWPDAEITGSTTVADPDGVRAAYARRMLELVDRTDIPVQVGAGRSLAGFEMGGVPEHDRFWDTPVVRRPADAGQALAALRHSIELGATIVAIGPYTNLALLERAWPGVGCGRPRSC